MSSNALSANEVVSGAEVLLLGLLWGSVGVVLQSKAGSLTEPVVPQPAVAR